jgi:hypothetical protein
LGLILEVHVDFVCVFMCTCMCVCVCVCVCVCTHLSKNLNISLAHAHTGSKEQRFTFFESLVLLSFVARHFSEKRRMFKFVSTFVFPKRKTDQLFKCLKYRLRKYQGLSTQLVSYLEASFKIFHEFFRINVSSVTEERTDFSIPVGEVL